MKKAQLCSIMLERKKEKKHLGIIIGNRESINQQDSSVILKTNKKPNYKQSSHDTTQYGQNLLTQRSYLVLGFKLGKNVRIQRAQKRNTKI